jgi:zinc transporter ZupT
LGGLEAPSAAPPRLARAAAAFTAAQHASGDRLVSSLAESDRSDRVAGFLCAFSLALSGVAIARSPVLLATSAIVVALVATRMTTRHATLAAVAVAFGGVAFVLGMVVAVLTDNGLY